MARNERRHFRRVEKSSAAGLINAIRCVLNFVCDNVGTDILIETKKKKKQQRMKEVARCNISRIYEQRRGHGQESRERRSQLRDNRATCLCVIVVFYMTPFLNEARVVKTLL